MTCEIKSATTDELLAELFSRSRWVRAPWKIVNDGKYMEASFPLGADHTLVLLAPEDAPLFLTSNEGKDDE